MNDADSILIDIRYALRQLREFKCIDRAIDALERVEDAIVIAQMRDEDGK